MLTCYVGFQFSYIYIYIIEFPFLFFLWDSGTFLRHLQHFSMFIRDLAS